MANVAPAWNSTQHGKLKELVRSRRQFSQRHIGQRYDRWRDSEKVYRLFVDPDAKAPDGTKKQPWDWSIVVPITYSIMQTELAFDLTLFTQRRPVIQLDGYGPEDVKAAKLMEQLLHHEWVVRRMLLDTYTWLLDRRRYGLGILWNTYVSETTRRTTKTPRSISLMNGLINIPLPGSTETVEEFPGYEGNQPYVVDPFQFWPDPRVSMARMEDGEFVGRTVRRSYAYMKNREREGIYTNVEKIPRVRTRSNRETGAEPESARDDIMGLAKEFDVRGDTIDFQAKGYVDLDEFVITIIPRDYNLSDTNYPEKWWITLANDEVVVRAERYEPAHQQYPCSAFESSIDAHTMFNPGDPELLQGVQDMMSWLLTSRFQNIRTSLNNMWLMNDDWVELRDILEPQPGRLLRLTKAGKDVAERLGLDKMLRQFPVDDVTKSHLGDLQSLIDLAQRTAASPENLQGIISQKDRTLGEQQMAVSAATRRLQVNAQLAWTQGVVPWSTQRVANIQENMSQERYVRVVGDWPRTFGPKQIGAPFMRLSPDEIQGQFIFEIIDGTINNQGQMLQSWKELWIEWGRQAVLQQTFDGVEIFRRIALLSGITDIDDFVLEPGTASGGQPALSPGPVGGGDVKVMPDEQALREEEKGNLVGVQSPLAPTNGRVPVR